MTHSPAARAALPDTLPISSAALADARATYDAGARRAILYFASKRDVLEDAPRRSDIDAIFAEADMIFTPGAEETAAEALDRKLLDAVLAHDHLATLRILRELSDVDPERHAHYIDALRAGVADAAETDARTDTATTTARTETPTQRTADEATPIRERSDAPVTPREVKTAEEIEALPDGSILVEVESDDIGVSIDLHEVSDSGRITSLDPSDRDDGEITWNAADIIEFASARDRRLFVGYARGETVLPGPLNVAELDVLPERSALITIPRDPRRRRGTHVYETYSRGRWTDMDPGDRFDGEQDADSNDVVNWAGRDDADVFLLFDPRTVG